MISVHIYGNSKQANTTSIKALVAAVSDFSADTGKPLFIGEFGAPMPLDEDQEKSLFVEMLKAIEVNNVPLPRFWVFDHSGQSKDWNVTFENKRSYMLKLVADANRRMKIKPNDR